MTKLFSMASTSLLLPAILVCLHTSSDLSWADLNGASVRVARNADTKAVRVALEGRANAGPRDRSPRTLAEVRTDRETGSMQVYNYWLDTWDPYDKEYRPRGADYRVRNNGNTIVITYDAGVTLRIENCGEGIQVRSGVTGGKWVSVRGGLVYYDRQKKIWWANRWGSWSFSTDNGNTWLDVPHVDLRLVASSDAVSTVDVFDGPRWVARPGELEFLDKRYLKSGFHRMDEFFPDLHDGKGYDGEPLVSVQTWKTRKKKGLQPDESIDVRPRPQTETRPGARTKVKEWEHFLRQEGSSNTTTHFTVPNPTHDYGPRAPELPQDGATKQ